MSLPLPRLAWLFGVLLLAASGCHLLFPYTGSNGPGPDAAASDKGPADATSSCTSDPDCQDALTCTTERCVEGTCQTEISSTTCLIDGACYPQGMPSPNNPCQLCDPKGSAIAWSPAVVGPCDDKNACTRDDACVNGTCTGTSFSCDDGNTCTQDLCDGKGGCTYSGVGGGCYEPATKTCYAAGTETSDCRRCTGGQLKDFRPCVGTVAGSGKAGFLDGAALIATLSSPHGLALDTSGTLYFSDRGNNVIRSLASGQVKTLAGSGQSGYKDGIGTAAQFSNPAGLALVQAAKSITYLIVADWSNEQLRFVSTDGTVQTPLASSSLFKGPLGLAAQDQAAGFTLYVTNQKSHTVSKIVFTWIDPGFVAYGAFTLAGSGSEGYLDGQASSAMFKLPQGLAASSSGAVYVADTGNHRVRLVASGQVTTTGGSGAASYKDGPALSASFNAPADIVIASNTSVYVSDTDNHCIRKIVGGQVSTVAGTGKSGYKDGNPQSAQFDTPKGLALSSTGDLYVADSKNNRIRIIKF